jgi:hypothetical protein
MSNFKNRLDELKGAPIVSFNPSAADGALLTYETLKTAKAIIEDLFPGKELSIDEMVKIHDILVKGEIDMGKAKLAAQISALTKKDSTSSVLDELMSLTKKNPEGVS